MKTGGGGVRATEEDGPVIDTAVPASVWVFAHRPEWTEGDEMGWFERVGRLIGDRQPGQKD